MPSNRDNVKPWFTTGKKPTQGQFHQLLDAIFFKDEGINMENVANLVTTLTGKAGKTEFDDHVRGERIDASGNVVYAQQANFLIEKVIIIPGVDANVRIGTTNGGEEVMQETAIAVADASTHVQIIDAFAVANRNLYINGITANTKIIILKRHIKAD